MMTALRMMWEQVWLRWMLGSMMAIGMVGMWLRAEGIMLTLNHSESLPYHLYLVVPGSAVKREDFVVFTPPMGEYPYIKQIAGFPGDKITHDDDTVVIHRVIGRVKSHSLTGQPLKSIAPGVIPEGHYFVRGTHKDSHDSRYKSVGVISHDRILGRAIPLF